MLISPKYSPKVFSVQLKNYTSHIILTKKFLRFNKCHRDDPNYKLSILNYNTYNSPNSTVLFVLYQITIFKTWDWDRWDSFNDFKRPKTSWCYQKRYPGWIRMFACPRRISHVDPISYICNHPPWRKYPVWRQIRHIFNS